jgi:Na+/H+ antiporter
VTSGHDELVLLGLLLAGGGLVVLARIVRIPYPILLVLGGLALGFVPGLPDVELDPEVVFIAFLPPLLYAAAFFTSLRDLRANLGQISLLSVGLVLATTVGVAVVAHAFVDGLPWAAAFVLGAIVSPTDPIAATSIAHRLGVSRRVVSIVEGESLINDGTALVAYRFAVVAVVSGTFSFWSASLEFVWSVAGGIGVGLVVGFLIRMLRKKINHPPTEITIALLSGYLGFLPADALGVSGVLAAVTVGIYMGWYTPELTTPETRLQGVAVWEIATFVLNSLLFGLVGLQLPQVIDAIDGYTWGELVGWGAIVAGTVIAIRVVWVFPLTYLPRMSERMRKGPAPPWEEPLLVAWMGMRGAVSLAAALALPFTTDAGDPFPARNLIVFLTFCVILATLVGQGLSLAPLIRWLDPAGDDMGEREDAKARILASDAALERLEQLIEEGWVYEDTAERTRGLYDFRKRRYRARLDGMDDDGLEERSQAFQRLRRELLAAEREQVVALGRQGRISAEVMRRVLRDLDLEDTRLDI